MINKANNTDRLTTKQVRDILATFLEESGIKQPNLLTWCNPYCGDGNISDVIKQTLEVDDIVTMDVKTTSRADYLENFLTYDFKGDNPHVIITETGDNPYEISIITKGLAELMKGGFLIAILDYSFFSGLDTRKKFLSRNMPSYKYVMWEGSGYSAKAVYVWEKGANPIYFKQKYLNEYEGKRTIPLKNG